MQVDFRRKSHHLRQRPLNLEPETEIVGEPFGGHRPNPLEMADELPPLTRYVLNPYRVPLEYKEEDEERIRTAGADAYVSKPISVARFVDEVNGLVAGD